MFLAYSTSVAAQLHPCRVYKEGGETQGSLRWVSEQLRPCSHQWELRAHSRAPLPPAVPGRGRSLRHGSIPESRSW